MSTIGFKDKSGAPVVSAADEEVGPVVCAVCRREHQAAVPIPGSRQGTGCAASVHVRKDNETCVAFGHYGSLKYDMSGLVFGKGGAADWIERAGVLQDLEGRDEWRTLIDPVCDACITEAVAGGTLLKLESVTWQEAEVLLEARRKARERRAVLGENG